MKKNIIILLIFSISTLFCCYKKIETITFSQSDFVNMLHPKTLTKVEIFSNRINNKIKCNLYYLLPRGWMKYDRINKEYFNFMMKIIPTNIILYRDKIKKK